MQKRTFGRTGMRLSLLGFGCGSVGGLMVRGDPTDQERTIARALEAGVNYFDTAVQYGDGVSERNLGRVLKKLKPADAVVGTKVRVAASELDRIGDAVSGSLEGSLQRLNLERVDIFYLHNPITAEGSPESLTAKQVLEEVVPAFDRLRQQGKTRFLGFTAVGETAALKRVIDARAFDVAQITLISSILRPLLPFLQITQPRTMHGCSTMLRRPVWGWSASACWLVARYPDPRSGTQSPAHHRLRLARLIATTPTWRVLEG